MKISELLNTPKESKDTTSSATTSSAIKAGQTQDIVPQDIVPHQFEGTTEVDSEIESHPDHSAITEGVSQIFRRQKGGKPTKGFRCTSGPRKGRIVAKPSTCFAKTDPVKSAKIRKKRQQKARIAGKKLAMTKRSGGGSRRLAGVQIKKKSMKGKSVAPRMKTRAPVKSRVLKPKKR
jgi:hypothetical protein|tara:strand:+ start:211 stop:741 length:531 start_codon:yes stop_codon:yes gene_type:complete